MEDRDERKPGGEGETRRWRCRLGVVQLVASIETRERKAGVEKNWGFHFPSKERVS